jgi:hypothetical protein
VPSGPAGATGVVGLPGSFLPDTVDRLGRVRERQHRVGDQVGVDLEGAQVEVVDGVAGLVVAGVELLTCRAAPDRLLLGAS